MTSRAVAGPREEAIRALVDALTRSGPITDRNPLGTIYSGFCPNVSNVDDGLMRVSRALPNTLVEIEAYDEYPYRRVWQSNALWATVTFCEGDVILFVAHDLTAWRNAKAETDTFYGVARAEEGICHGHVRSRGSRYGAHAGEWVELEYGPTTLDGERWYSGKLPDGRHVFVRDPDEGPWRTDSGGLAWDAVVRLPNGEPLRTIDGHPNEIQWAAIRRRLNCVGDTVTVSPRPFDLPADYVLCVYSDGFTCGIASDGAVSS